jgi:hypothetical protein
MHALAILLFATAALSPQPILTTTLILRNGTHFEVEGPIREERGRIIFRSGTLIRFQWPRWTWKRRARR